MKLQTIFAIVLTIFACAHARPSCSFNQYYSTTDAQCKDCMACPINNIILEPCGKNTDTKCGPWKDWSFSFKQKSKAEQMSTESKVDESNKSTESFDSHHWFTIAMVLLGILCFLCVCIAGYIIVACFVWKRKDKEIIYNPVYVERPQPEEPRYVEMVTSSRDRLKQHVPSRIGTGSWSTFQSTSALPLLQSQNSENIYVNCMDYPMAKSKDTHDYVYLESN